MSARIARRLGLFAGACALLVVGAVAPANATTEPSPGATPDEVLSHYTAQQLFLSQVKDVPATATLNESTDGRLGSLAKVVITCAPIADTPHASSGAGGVIYKTRVACHATGPAPSSVQVRVRGGLFLATASGPNDTSNGNFVQVRTSDETRTITIGAKAETFYTPRTGTAGATGQGNWIGTSTVEIVVPAGQKVGSATSGIAYISR
jgi:hypothetical protein